MFKSIFGRLLWVYIVILVVVFTVIFGAMSGFYLKFTEKTLFEEVTRATDSISHMTLMLNVNMNDGRAKSMYDTSLVSWSELVGADITVTDTTGEVFASTKSFNSIPDDMLDDVNSGKNFTKYTNFGGNYNSLVYTIGMPIIYNGYVVGCIFYTATVGEMFDSFDNFASMLLMSCLISASVAIVLIFMQTKKITKPIADINSAVLAIASGKFDRRLPVKTSDETGQLASSFNYMAESLEKLDNMRAGFISDVSHELRTPMTSISGFVGGILDGTIPEDKHSEYLGIVYEESKRLSKMTSDMLEMSKMSSSEYTLDIKKFDICELIRLAIINLESKIDQKSLEIDLSLSEDKINVLADRDSILRVIINLLDNAVKFSFDNTKITISAKFDQANAYVSIGNFGIGIENEDLPHIFDRFYKTDKSRGKDKTGAGLGLSMAKNIITLHGGSIWAESSNPKEGSSLKYTTFIFSLELA